VTGQAPDTSRDPAHNKISQPRKHVTKLTRSRDHSAKSRSLQDKGSGMATQPYVSNEVSLNRKLVGPSMFLTDQNGELEMSLGPPKLQRRKPRRGQHQRPQHGPQVQPRVAGPGTSDETPEDHHRPRMIANCRSQFTTTARNRQTRYRLSLLQPTRSKIHYHATQLFKRHQQEARTRFPDSRGCTDMQPRLISFL
jgi:hypothetical protein